MSVDNPAWEERCAPLRELLRTPRGWKEIERWCRKNRVSAPMMSQMLSWLDCKHLARYEKERWRSV